ncbi:hypothetical protein [Paenibacillus lutimineralis]|uniref:Uncharacterized protein n=1 Tax=Paenibacillus lutimineralis TaxID=2707005 RepID=A0A3Q9I9V7_9BACL|nr:hypothetical protein [Paenibacillus lutimineralis]AZS16211.1 hypothetical protein EI981_18350 [Paenibacillus lutimineralis]
MKHLLRMRKCFIRNGELEKNVLNADRTIAYMGHAGEVTTTKGTIAKLGLMPVVEEVSRT